MTRSKIRRLRRGWRRSGLPGFGAIPEPYQPAIDVETPPLDSQVQARLERLASSGEIASLSHAAQLTSLLVLLTEAEILASATRDGMDAIGRDLDRSRAALAGGAR
jgi:hypothetical protein